MTARIDLNNGYAVVSLTGEVDLYTSPDARKLILGSLEEGRPTVVDLSAVQYIDSSGVASLVEGLQRSRERQLFFGLIGVSEPAMNVLKLARLDAVFSIYPDIDHIPAQ